MRVGRVRDAHCRKSALPTPLLLLASISRYGMDGPPFHDSSQTVTSAEASVADAG